MKPNATYVIRYANQTGYMGIDVFLLVTPSQYEGIQAPLTTHELKDAQRYGWDKALEVQQKVPVLDKGHTLAQVVELITETEVVRYKTGTIAS